MPDVQISVKQAGPVGAFPLDELVLDLHNIYMLTASVCLEMALAASSRSSMLSPLLVQSVV